MLIISNKRPPFPKSHTFSAYWLGSSVVSVHISVKTGNLLLEGPFQLFFAGSLVDRFATPARCL